MKPKEKEKEPELIFFEGEEETVPADDIDRQEQ